MVPGYVLDDMSLAGVLDEAGAEEMWASARRAHDRRTARRRRRARCTSILHVDADATLVELAALMVDAHAQIAVVDGDRRAPRFVTLPSVMDAILAVCGDGGAAA